MFARLRSTRYTNFVLEILMIVVGINVALWFEGWFDNLEKIIPALAGLADAQPETQANAIFEPSNYLFFQPADFTYRSMQESGDFRLLSDAEVKKGILRLIRKYREIEELQINFLQAMDDIYIPTMMQKFDLMEGRIADVSLVEDQAFLNFFLYTLQETDGRNDAYVQARAQAQDLLGAITSQLGKETT